MLPWWSNQFIQDTVAITTLFIESVVINNCVLALTMLLIIPFKNLKLSVFFCFYLIVLLSLLIQTCVSAGRVCHSYVSLRHVVGPPDQRSDAAGSLRWHQVLPLPGHFTPVRPSGRITSTVRGSCSCCSVADVVWRCWNGAGGLYMKQSRSINIQHMDPGCLMEEDLMEHYCFPLWYRVNV